MSFKSILAILIVIAFLVFLVLKIQINGDPNSHFNKTTRFDLGVNGVVRTILGLHFDGDARKEYLGNKGKIVIEWFKPASQDIDAQVVKDFAAKVAEYTGRPTEVLFGGAVSDGVTKISDLATYNLKATADNSASTIVVFFLDDYTPRPDGEISSTYKESGMLISINAHRDFLQGYLYNLNRYYLSSMIHEFGHQLGLEHNDERDCVMSTHAGIEGHPVEYYGKDEPQEFCKLELDQLKELKYEFQ